MQIFGKKKCNDTKKAQHYFKERGIEYMLDGGIPLVVFREGVKEKIDIIEFARFT